MNESLAVRLKRETTLVHGSSPVTLHENYLTALVMARKWCERVQDKMAHDFWVCDVGT